ncbi:MAG: sugar phosphate isomerase/epimerase [bacterium]|nr:sugar phosphate isomerase/epimerase [bacterium]
MRLSFSTLGCPNWDIKKIVESARRYGYNGVELRGSGRQHISLEISPIERNEIKRLFEDNGIEICCISAYTRFASPIKDEREANIENLIRYCELAKEIDAPIVRTFIGDVPKEIIESEYMNYIPEALHKVGEKIKDFKVDVVVETHDYFSTGKLVSDIIKRADIENIKALWDVWHPYRSGESPKETLEYLKDYLRHMHIKDAKRIDDDWHLVLPGEGDIPLREIIDLLRAIDYQGYLSFEWEKMWHPEILEPEIAFPRYIEYMRSIGII